MPLLISIDGEWGVSMRLDSSLVFPRQMTLGAISDNKIIYDFGVEVAKQCKCMGIQMNFAPDVDINSNPNNPVINSRSFGEDKINVALKGSAYMKGLQDNGILACAKHFPGHGDTDQDSHYTLPTVKSSREVIDALHLYPFKYLIEQGVKSVMVGHLCVPVIDSTANLSSSMSKVVIQDLLKQQLGFKGIVVSDALDMKGVSDYYAPGDLEYNALKAGNDILLLPVDVPCAVETIKEALLRCDLELSIIEESVRKILYAKYWVGLSQLDTINVSKLDECLNNKNAQRIKDEIFKNAITIVKNNKNILPLQRLDTLKIATLQIGFDSLALFQQSLSRFTTIKHFYLSRDSAMRSGLQLLDSLAPYNLVIVSLQNSNQLAKRNYGIRKATAEFLNILKSKKKVILDVFANTYSLSQFSNFDGIEAIVVSYDDDEVSEKISAGLIFGEYPAIGKLPVTASPAFPINSGIKTTTIQRLALAEIEKDKNQPKLKEIDSIAIAGVQAGAYPGCVVLAAKDNRIFYEKSFGYHQYDSVQPVKTDDIYDLASLTKMLATTLSIMKLYDEGTINLDAKLSDYLTYLKGTNKEEIIIRDVLTHQAGLEPWIAFYTETLNEEKYNIIYKHVPTNDYVRVADSLYVRRDYKETIMKEIIDSKLQKKKKYKYSDLGFYLMRELVEQITGTPIDKYVQDQFYKPMELTSLGYHPLKRFSLNRIVPTEKDETFRKQLIHGDVHDQGAALLGGVSGHAGVFGDAFDVAVVMQMWLQGGEYMGKHYFKKSTVDEFTRCQFPENDNRRGLGFDKPILSGTGGPTCSQASLASFGHTGFTGVYAWADPKTNLVFVFLSNRVNPNTENNKLQKMNIRTHIQQKLYEYLGQ